MTDATEIQEMGEYLALETDQMAVYDVLGQRGFDHDACMAGVMEFSDSLPEV